MKKNKKAFSLIEIIIATGILVVSVFGVYKLIGENIKLINNSENYTQTNRLFPALIECVENLGFTGFNISSERNYYFSLGDSDLNGCSYDNVSGTGTVIDNIFYEFEGEITGTGTDYTNWNFSIKNEVIKTENQSFTQIND